MPVTTSSLLSQLEEAFNTGDQAGCWCLLTHPTKLTTLGKPWIEIAKVVDIHKDGYFSLVSSDSFFAPQKPCGVVHTYILRRDEINLDWVKSGYIDTLDNGRIHWTGDALQFQWFLNKTLVAEDEE